MRIAVHDGDLAFSRSKIKFPNLALMKISSYYKSTGNTVQWWKKGEHYNKIFSSKVFTYTPEEDLPPDTIKGGTGRDLKNKLPPEIDNVIDLDYSLYPDCDFAVGFLTRGCPNNCQWCAVSAKEGGIKPYREYTQIVRSDTKKLLLMDNNILACDFGIEQLEKLTATGFFVDVNQGLDCRKVTPEIADILSKLKRIRFLRFSCDTKGQIEPLTNAVLLLRERGVAISAIFVYVLVKRDICEAVEIVDKIKKLGSITVFAQSERIFTAEKSFTKEQDTFARRYVWGGSFRKETWEQYLCRHGIYFENGEVKKCNLLSAVSARE